MKIDQELVQVLKKTLNDQSLNDDEKEVIKAFLFKVENDDYSFEDLFLVINYIFKFHELFQKYLE
jgi:hypothetical protein